MEGKTYAGTLVVKRGPTVLANVRGLEFSTTHVTIADLERLVELEKFLEHIFGLRFHLGIETEN